MKSLLSSLTLCHLLFFYLRVSFPAEKKTRMHDPYKAYELPERLSDLKLGNLRQCCHFLEDEMRKILNYRGKHRVYNVLNAMRSSITEQFLIATVLMLKMDLDSIRFSSFFVRFFIFLLLREKVCDFFSAILYVHIHTNQTVIYLTKVFRKKIFVNGYKVCFGISLLSFIQKIFEQNFYLYTTVYLVPIWTYENTNEKGEFFSRRSKNVKKRTKTDKKRMLCEFTFSQFITLSIACVVDNIGQKPW